MTDYFPEGCLVDNVLTITTAMLQIKFHAGAIIYIEDIATEEVLADGAHTDIPFYTLEKIGFGVGNDHFNPSSKAGRKPYNVVPTPTKISTTQYELLYEDMQDTGSGEPVEGTSLTYVFNVDDSTGEIYITATAVEPVASGKYVYLINLPVVGAGDVAGRSAILGYGKEILYANATVDDTTSLGVPFAISQGNDSLFAMWSEDNATPISDAVNGRHITLNHTQNGVDLFIMSEPYDFKLTDGQTINLNQWRLGTYETWLDAVKRWRTLYETRTGVKKLWEHDISWVRNIHSIYQVPASDMAYLSGTEVATIDTNIGSSAADRAKLMVLCNNGDRMMCSGDHHYGVSAAGTPSASQCAMIRTTYGHKLMLYHSWTIIFSVEWVEAHKSTMDGLGWLPHVAPYYPLDTTPYFLPDFNDGAGTGATWDAYWTGNVAKHTGGGYALSTAWKAHPGSTAFLDYIADNIANEVVWAGDGISGAHPCDGLYIDEGCGVYLDYFNASAAEVAMIINDVDPAYGQILALDYVRSQCPTVALMSEYYNPDTLKQCPFTWSNFDTSHETTTPNHPLRIALTGSYCWNLERDLRGASLTGTIILYNARVGAIPGYHIYGFDYNISEEVGDWAVALSKLFCNYRLHSDVPTTWVSGTHAYYRSGTHPGYYVRMQDKSGGGYEYVLEDPDTSEFTLLTIDGSNVINEVVSLTESVNSKIFIGDLTIDTASTVFYNLTVTGTITVNENCTIKNSIFGAISIASGKTVTAAYNASESASASGSGTYSDAGSTTLWETDPELDTDFKPQTGSPVIGAGVWTGSSVADFEGKAQYNETNGVSIGAYRGWASGTIQLPGE